MRRDRRREGQASACPRTSRRSSLPVLRNGTRNHPSAQRKAARGDTRPPNHVNRVNHVSHVNHVKK